MEYAVKEKSSITSPAQLARIFQEILANEQENDQEKEHFWVVGANTRNRIEYIELVSLGTLNFSSVHPRETFRLAIIKRVDSIFIVHNHPSGHLEPSNEDTRMTKRLREAGEIVGITLEDSIIIGENSFFSFANKGLL